MKSNSNEPKDGVGINDLSSTKQRVFTRLPFEHAVQCIYAPGESGTVTIQDVSRGGFRLALPRYLRPGRIIRLCFDDLLYKNNSIDFWARIVWCKPATKKQDLFSAGVAVEHRQPIVLAEMSELFYAAVSRLRKKGVCHAGTTLADTLHSPSLAS